MRKTSLFSSVCETTSFDSFLLPFGFSGKADNAPSRCKEESQTFQSGKQLGYKVSDPLDSCVILKRKKKEKFFSSFFSSTKCWSDFRLGPAQVCDDVSYCHQSRAKAQRPLNEFVNQRQVVCLVRSGTFGGRLPEKLFFRVPNHFQVVLVRLFPLAKSI